MRAVIYSRFSTDMQDAGSLADQERICREYAERQGMTVSAVYSDAGISGAAIGNRPQFRAMMTAAESRSFDVLLAMDLSRLSRDPGDLATSVRMLKFWERRVVAIQDNFDTAAPGHEVMLGVSGIVSEQFRAMVRHKTRAALATRAKSGRAAGGRAYGYEAITREDGTKWRRVVPEQAEWVRWIFNERAAGAGMRRIAADLNRMGVPSPGATWAREKRREDAKWLQSGVRVILHNGDYRGRVTWGRTTWVKNPVSGQRVSRDLPESEWIVTDAPELRIITDEQWERARALDGTAHKQVGAVGVVVPRRGREPRHLLSGILRCAECGSSLVVAGTPLRYLCSGHKDGGEHACANSVTVQKTLAEALLTETIFSRLLSPEGIAVFSAELRAMERKRDAETATAQPDRAAVARLAAQVEQLRAMRDAGLLTAEEHSVLDGRARAELAAVSGDGKAPGRTDVRRTVKRLPEAAGMLRESLRLGSEPMADPQALRNARAVLLEAFGGPVPVRPSADRSHLVAKVGLTARPLLRAAGGTVDFMVAGAASGYEPQNRRRFSTVLFELNWRSTRNQELNLPPHVTFNPDQPRPTNPHVTNGRVLARRKLDRRAHRRIPASCI